MKNSAAHAGDYQIKTTWIFAGIVAAFCLWVFSLPVFPTQDGPMHRYYIHILDSLLTHQHVFTDYRIRKPFPPYATQYLSLALLSHFFSFDLAEKIFVVGVILCLAYGLRFCALSLGPSGGVVSLFVAPLLLHWAQMMGFMNYSLALGIFFIAVGCWRRAIDGARWYWFWFALAICMLTVTHPVPLAILIALCALDLILGTALRRSFSGSPVFTRDLVFPIAAVLLCCVALMYPASIMDKSREASTLAGFGFHLQSTLKYLVLFGLSPYYAASRAPLINLYRLALYVTLAGGLVLAWFGLRQALREHRFGMSQTFLISVVILGACMPFLPDYVNGSGYFTTRMMIFLWLGTLAAASGATLKHPTVQRALTGLAVAFAAVSLMTAAIYLRPVANDLAHVEREPLPAHVSGIILVDPHLDDYARRIRQLAFDPYAWSSALAFVRQDDTILDSPWIDQNIAPIQAVPGSHQLVDDIRMIEDPAGDPPWRAGASLPRSRQAELVDHSQVILYVTGVPAQGISIANQLPPDEAGQFSCASRGWYLDCLRTTPVRR